MSDEFKIDLDKINNLPYWNNKLEEKVLFNISKSEYKEILIEILNEHHELLERLKYV